MTKVRELQQKRGWAWSTVVVIVKPTLLAATRHHWIDGEKIPATGGCVVAVNHISHLDPMTLGWFLYEHGRLVRYLAKEALFRTPLLKYIVKDAGQIPVQRMSEGAASAFDAAVEAVHSGELHRRLSRGHHHQGPRRLADARQDRRRADRARDGVSGHPGRAVGRAGHPAGVHRPAARVPAQDRVLQGRRPGRPRRPAATSR